MQLSIIFLLSSALVGPIAARVPSSGYASSNSAWGQQGWAPEVEFSRVRRTFHPSLEHFVDLVIQMRSPHRSQIARDLREAHIAQLYARAKAASKAPFQIQQYTGSRPESQMRAQNSNPNRKLTDADVSQIKCKKLTDCPCAKGSKSVSCINGKCSCNNKTIEAISGITMKALTAFANSKILNGVGEVFKVIEDIKQVGATVAGTILGPEAKIALKAAMMAIPDFGPSHIDDATHGVLKKVGVL